MDTPAQQLRTPAERTRYVVALVFSILCWCLPVAIVAVSRVAGLVVLFYALIIAAVVGAVHALFLAHIRGNGVRIGPKQMPAIWERVVRASAKLGLDQAPEVYLVQAGGVLNAFATRLFGRRFVILHSEIVDACLAVRGPSDGLPDELDFVIGHEIGHLACGHLTWLLLPARIVPLLGPAYSRACEYTCDRCGHTVVGDLERSSRALAVLAAGGRCAANLDLDAFVAQREETRSFWMAVYELNATHPYLSKRVAALRELTKPGMAPTVGRNAAAYPLSPLFAFASGGASAASFFVIAYIGVLAAIAIPSFKKYQMRSKATQTMASDARERSSEKTPIDLVAGDRFHWSMRAPGAAWQALPNEVARQQNPLADRWLTRSDLDAHLLVVAEHVASPITLDHFEQAVLANLHRSTPSFHVTRRVALNDGQLLEATALVNGLHLSYRYGLFVTAHEVYQVLAFAPQPNMPAVEAEMLTALHSFTAE